MLILLINLMEANLAKLHGQSEPTFMKRPFHPTVLF